MTDSETNQGSAIWPLTACREGRVQRLKTRGPFADTLDNRSRPSRLPSVSRRAELQRALSRHIPTRPGEQAAKQRMADLLGAEEDPFARSTFVPGHFTASAFVLCPDAAHLLLVFHTRLQRWLQPGGHIEPEDSSLLHAALRELVEETGLPTAAPETEGIFDLDVHVIPARSQEPAHEHHDVRYLFRASSRELRAGSGVTEARWVPLAHVANLETDESVLGAVRKVAATTVSTARGTLRT